MLDIALVVRDLVFFLLLALVVILLTRRLKVPYTVGLVIAGLALAFLHITPEAHLSPDMVFFIFLPALLFEGAWSVRFSLLRENWRVIFFLAGPGLLLSIAIIAGALHLIEQLDWITALLLAAILSPTDPIAVLGLFRQLHVNARLSTIIEGESLFNDGVAGSLYQTFLALLLMSINGHPLSGGEAWLETGKLFVIEAGGGILLGGLSGLLISQFHRLLDEPLVETTVTLITAYGLYWLADQLHISPLVTVIVASLILGNYGRRVGMSPRTQENVEMFWTMLAFLANALIFLLIGVQLFPLPPLLFGDSASTTWFVALCAIGVVLVSRFALILVLTARNWLRIPRWVGHGTEAIRQPLPRSWRLIIFWSGLRGALSLALVLALPTTIPERENLLISTYAVVLFTLIIQGVSIRWILQRLLAPQKVVKESSTEEPSTRVIEDASPESENAAEQGS